MYTIIAKNNLIIDSLSIYDNDENEKLFNYITKKLFEEILYKQVSKNTKHDKNLLTKNNLIKYTEYTENNIKNIFNKIDKYFSCIPWWEEFKKTFVNTENELDFLYKINNFKFDNQYYINKKITNNKVTFFITQLKELTLYI